MRNAPGPAPEERMVLKQHHRCHQQHLHPEPLSSRSTNSIIMIKKIVKTDSFLQSRLLHLVSKKEDFSLFAKFLSVEHGLHYVVVSPSSPGSPSSASSSSSSKPSSSSSSFRWTLPMGTPSLLRKRVSHPSSPSKR